MTRLITFTDDNMTIAANICVASAFQNNVHEAKIYRPKDIDAKFYKANKEILDAPRAGYWLWKPYIIDLELKKMKDGDYLIYADAGVEIINNVNHIIDRMTGDIWLFGNQYQHVHWCKADAINAILPDFDEDSRQVQASVIIIRKSKESILFVADWLKWCCVPGLINDSDSEAMNSTEFREHRHDQAILTCCAIRDNITFHWWPAMYNCGAFTYSKEGYNDDYPVLFHHHRCRNNEIQQWGIFRDYFHKKYPAII